MKVVWFGWSNRKTLPLKLIRKTSPFIRMKFGIHNKEKKWNGFPLKLVRNGLKFFFESVGTNFWTSFGGIVFRAFSLLCVQNSIRISYQTTFSSIEFLSWGDKMCLRLLESITLQKIFHHKIAPSVNSTLLQTYNGVEPVLHRCGRNYTLNTINCTYDSTKSLWIFRNDLSHNVKICEIPNIMKHNFHCIPKYKATI